MFSFVRAEAGFLGDVHNALDCVPRCIIILDMKEAEAFVRSVILTIFKSPGLDLADGPYRDT